MYEVDKNDIPKADCYMVVDKLDNSFKVVASREDVVSEMRNKQRFIYPIDFEDGESEWFSLDIPDVLVTFYDEKTHVVNSEVARV